MKLTDHAVSRGVERLGVPAERLQAICQRAFDRGFETEETRGELRSWMVLRSYGRTARSTPKIHEGHVFIFRRELVLTIMDLPRGFHAEAWRLRH